MTLPPTASPPPPPDGEALAALARAVRALRDRDEVAECVRRFAVALDLRDGARLRACFTDEIRPVYDPVIGAGPTGPVRADDFVARAARDFRGYRATHHFCSVYTVTVDGDAATTETYFQASHYQPEGDGGPVFVHKGYYTHALQRTAEGWRIAGWRMHVLWGEGNRTLLDRALRGGAS